MMCGYLIAPTFSVCELFSRIYSPHITQRIIHLENPRGKPNRDCPSFHSIPFPQYLINLSFNGLNHLSVMSFIENLPEHFENELCPSCRSHDKRRQEWIGKLVRRSSKFGKFLGCSRYPDCKYTYNFAAKNKNK
jgi:hypothetical protein